MGGGKSAPQPSTPSIDTSGLAASQASQAYMTAMSQSNNKVLQQLMDNQNSMATLKPPELSTPPKVDWAAQLEALKAKASAAYQQSAGQKVGRAATIVTSPLLDDTPATTTKQSLGGS